jgi:soluble lytic murein transglycosylase-like protein
MRSLGLCLVLAAGTALAGESVLLTNGARLRIDHHEIEGGRVRLYNTSGFIEMDAALVSGFEADEMPPAPAPVAATTPQPAQTAQAPAQPVLTPAQLADAAAYKYGLPPSLVRNVMAAESAFQPQAVSPKGAIGLMQLMPGTARDLGVDPQDPAQNVDGGTRHLRDLLLRYDGNLWHALAAYNAGPGAVAKSPDGLPPYRETLRYVNRIHKGFKADSAR